MDGGFDVFDDWGSFVGRFTPAGAGWTDNIFLVIAMLFLGVVGFLIYLLFKLIVRGFRAVKERDWGKAIGYWAVPGLLFFSFAVPICKNINANYGNPLLFFFKLVIMCWWGAIQVFLLIQNYVHNFMHGFFTGLLVC